MLHLQAIPVRFSTSQSLCYIHHGTGDDTFYVGASRTAYRGDRLQAISVEDPRHLEPIVKDSTTRFDVGPADLRTLIKKTWRDVSEETRSLIKANDRSGYDEYTSALRRNFETFANTPGSQISCPDIDCKLDIRDRGHAFPLGTRNTAVPVVSRLKAAAALNWDNEASRTQLQGVRLSIPCSSYMSSKSAGGHISQFAMTPNKESWQSVVDETLEPLRDYSTPALQSVVRESTDENIATVTKSIAEFGAYLVKREMMFGSQVPTNLRPQMRTEDLRDRAKSRSDWTFDLVDNGTPSLNPRLTAAAIPIPGLDCIDSDTRVGYDTTVVIRV
jgi:hypothetical protein